MDEQGYKFGVGVLVVASLVIAIILILFFGAAPNLFSERYLVTIRFDAAPGVTSDTPVRKNGVQIGRVKSVQLLDEDGVDLTLELDSEYKVRAGELPRIGKGSLITGDAVVEFFPPTPVSLVERFDGVGGSPQDGILDVTESQLASADLKNGDFLRGGRVAPDPMDAIINMQDSMSSTLRGIESAAGQVQSLASDVQDLISGSDGELKRVADKAEQTIDNFNRTLASIESVFSDPNLKQTLETVANRLPQLVDEAENVLQQTDATLSAFEDAGRAAEVTINNVAAFTEPLGQQGEQFVGDALRTLNNLDSLLTDLRRVSQTINQVGLRVNNSQGSLAKLLDDDQLYYRFIDTLQNVETLTRRLQPIVEDARVFSDKAARNPASLIDIRGALRGRPPAAGIK
jgi:phospholipid/cholesterol/gamma-HCH transport system substrate-binding protein